MEVTPTGDVVVGIKRATMKGVLLLLGGIPLIGMCILLCVVPPWYVQVIGGIGVVLFGFLAPANACLFFSRKSGLTIDRDGIIDRTSLLSAGRIRWEDIRGIRCGPSISTLIVDVHDPQLFVERGNAPLRWLKAINLRMVGSPVVLNLEPLDAPALELAGVLEEFHARAMAPEQSSRRIARKSPDLIAHKPTRLLR